MSLSKPRRLQSSSSPLGYCARALLDRTRLVESSGQVRIGKSHTKKPKNTIHPKKIELPSDEGKMIEFQKVPVRAVERGMYLVAS